VTAPFGPLGGLYTATDNERRITIGDVERQLRSLGGSAQSAVRASSSNAATALGVAAALLVAASYLLGRRRGKRRSSVLEIRRV